MSFKERILLTGFSGYIGQHLLPLLDTHFEIIQVGRTAPHNNSDFIQCDLTQDNLETLCNNAKANALIHLAWNVQGNYWESEDNIIWKNVSIRLVESFLRSGGKKVMAIGSCAEYEWTHGPCQVGVTPLSTSNSYAREKNLTYLALQNMCDQYNALFIWPRVFYSFGPGEPINKLISSIIFNLINSQIGVCKHGNQKLDYLYIKDVALALLSAFQHSQGGIINIAKGECVYLPDILNLLAEKCQKSSLLNVNTLLPHPMRTVIAKTDHLDSFGWKPLYTLDQALSETVTALKNQNFDPR